MIIRVNKDKTNPYVMVNKSFVNDKNISFKAKGVLLYLLSKPDDWKVYETEIVKNGTDGRDSIRSGIKELIELGYIERTLIKDEQGKFKGYEYDVYEVSSVDGKSDNGLSDNGKSNTTNNNVTNNEKTKDYIILANDGHVFSKIYLKVYNQYFDINHPTISMDNYSKLCTWYDDIICEKDVDREKFKEGVIEHFENLPESNNGSIIAFMAASDRYFYIEYDGVVAY